MKIRMILKVMLALLLSGSVSAFAKTWYVRTDGGTELQCSGTSNAAYTGGISTQWIGRGYTYPIGAEIADANNNVQRVTTGGSTGSYPPTWNRSGTTPDGSVVWTYQRKLPSGQACAYKHPFWLLNQSKWTWNVAPGDTIKFADQGPYYIGLMLNGLGEYWPWCNGQNSACSLPALPKKVSLLGYNAGSCHNSSHTALVNPTQFIGLNQVFGIIDMRGSDGVDAECFDITQPDQCTLSGITVIPSNLNCSNGKNNYVYSGGLILSYLGVNGPINSTVRDLQIHGLANQAVTGGKMNILGAVTAWSIRSNTATFTATNSLKAGDTVTFQEFANSSFFNGQTATVLGGGLSGSQFEVSFPHADAAATEAGTFGAGTMTFSDIYMYGNANTGWNGDAGGCTANCESTGTINLSYISAYWSGCMEVKPNGGKVGGRGVTTCVDQAFNGNGDNIVMVATGGTWNWDHLTAKWGTQDGIDLLHTGDDLTSNAVIHTDEVDSEGNEGQQWKVGGTTTGTNMRIIANCRRLEYPFPPNPPGYNAYVGLACRAFSGMALAVSAGHSISIANSTVVGYANPLIDIDCWDNVGADCPPRSFHVNLANDVLYGYDDPKKKEMPAGVYWGAVVGDPFGNPGSSISNMLWAPKTLRPSSGSGPSSGCPQDPRHETSQVCADPMLMGERNPNRTTLDDFNIEPETGSPVDGAGLPVPGITLDLDGKTRPGHPSIGAVEPEKHSSVAVPRPPTEEPQVLPAIKYLGAGALLVAGAWGGLRYLRSGASRG